MTTPYHIRYTFFEQHRQKIEEGIVLKLLEQAKTLDDANAGWNCFQKALLHLKKIHDVNPKDPVVIKLVGIVRDAVWADIRERPPLLSGVDEKTFDALLNEHSFKKFRERSGILPLSSHLKAKPDNQ